MGFHVSLGECIGFIGFWGILSPPIVESQMEKKMETGVIFNPGHRGEAAARRSLPCAQPSRGLGF